MKTIQMFKSKSLLFAALFAVMSFFSSCQKKAAKPQLDPELAELVGVAVGTYDYEARYYVWNPDNESYVSLGRENYQEGLFELRLNKDNELMIYEDGAVLLRTDELLLKNGGFTFRIPEQSWEDGSLSVQGKPYYNDLGEDAEGLFMDVFDYVNFAVTTQIDGNDMLILTQGYKRD
ncbi:MAG: hypothetical protein AAGI49_08810 [Bacteroidota bacterium]